MQDRSPPTRRNPLATHGRTIHAGQTQKSECTTGKSALSVLQRLAITDPGKLAQIAYGLLPRDDFISVEQRTPGNLDPDEWAILRRVIDLIQANAKSAELEPVLETIENALRADQAKVIEAE